MHLRVSGIFGRIEGMWRASWFGYALAAAALILGCVWATRPTVPDYPLVSMGVAAGIMALRSDMSGREKWLWTIVLFVFAYAGFRGVNSDRRKQDAFQSGLVHQFRSIAAEMKQTNTQNQQQFSQTTAQLSQTANQLGKIVGLEAENLRNTQPRAIMSSRGLTPEASVVAKTPIPFNAYYENIGNDVATNVVYDARVYTAKLDDKAEQENFLEAFNKWWKQSKHQGGEKVITAPWDPESTFTFWQTFSDSELREIGHTKTYYYLIRIAYSDHTGRWMQDFCAGLQSPGKSPFSHPCLVGRRQRYPAH